MADKAFVDVATGGAGDGSTPFDTVGGETIKEPQFHRFQDMSLELRHQVYEEYFLDEQDSVCRGWPDINAYDAFVEITHQHAHDAHVPSVPFNTQFFPNLCLVNRETGLEAAKFLISKTKLSFTYYEHIEPVMYSLSLFRDHHLLDNVHKLASPAFVAYTPMRTIGLRSFGSLRMNVLAITLLVSVPICT